MNKIKIYNQYAMEQGYESWRELTNSYRLEGQITTSEYLDHQNKVTDLIQEELKKKIAEEQYPNHQVYQEYKYRKQEILNTEIL